MVAAGELAREYRDELMGRVDAVFARREPWLQAGKYVRALTAEVPRKNGWQIAEWASDASPDKTQRLLNHAVRDEHAAMEMVAAFVGEHLRIVDDPFAVVVLDESGQEKKGASTAGVKRQYVGCAGRVSKAVNIVYATLASGRGHALAGARPYLPQEWAEDLGRRAKAAVPKHVVFKTKPALAVDILTDLQTAGLCRRGPPATRSTDGTGPCASSVNSTEAVRK
ncbi:IS701 family transposase [Nonomuraea sp. NPDC003707]